MRKLRLLILSFFIAVVARAQVVGPIVPQPSEKPSTAQRLQIERKYGMFIHFSINTFVDKEWTDGSIPAKIYHPAAVDADQWVRVAKESGMRYVILVAKHHDGFCLWDSRYTEYDVASSGNPTNVVEEVAKACKKYDMGMGIYYSLWDRHQDGAYREPTPESFVKGSAEADKAYNTYMIAQLDEIMDIIQQYTSVVEFWFDGGWVKSHERWPVNDIYQCIKSREPNCQIGINWPIGKPDDINYSRVFPKEQREGFPIKYFPSDFRLGDPYLPLAKDPKLYSHEGKMYYMPWESTICLTKRWFYNTKDHKYKSLKTLEQTFSTATANDNILIINSPPTREGKLRERDVEVLQQLKQRLTQSGKL